MTNSHKCRRLYASPGMAEAARVPLTGFEFRWYRSTLCFAGGSCTVPAEGRLAARPWLATLAVVSYNQRFDLGWNHNHQSNMDSDDIDFSDLRGIELTLDFTLEDLDRLENPWETPLGPTAAGLPDLREYGKAPAKGTRGPKKKRHMKYRRPKSGLNTDHPKLPPPADVSAREQPEDPNQKNREMTKEERVEYNKNYYRLNRERIKARSYIRRHKLGGHLDCYRADCLLCQEEYGAETDGSKKS